MDQTTSFTILEVKKEDMVRSLVPLTQAPDSSRSVVDRNCKHRRRRIVIPNILPRSLVHDREFDLRSVDGEKEGILSLFGVFEIFDVVQLDDLVVDPKVALVLSVFAVRDCDEANVSSVRASAWELQVVDPLSREARAHVQREGRLWVESLKSGSRKVCFKFRRHVCCVLRR